MSHRRPNSHNVITAVLGLLTVVMVACTSNPNPNPVVTIDEAEPNNAIASAQAINYRTTVRGAISTDGDEDFFSFTAKPGDIVVVDVDARITNNDPRSDLDSELFLYDASGQLLAYNDDVRMREANYRDYSDSFLTFEVTTAGTYFLRIKDYSDNQNPAQGGATYTYSLELSEGPPNWSMRAVGGVARFVNDVDGRAYAGVMDVEVQAGAGRGFTGGTVDATLTGPGNWNGGAPQALTIDFSYYYPDRIVQFVDPPGVTPTSASHEGSRAKGASSYLSIRPNTFSGVEPFATGTYNLSATLHGRSLSASFTVNTDDAIGVPEPVTINASPTIVTADWPGVAGAESYDAEIWNDADETFVVGSRTTDLNVEFTDLALEPGEYSMVVFALDYSSRKQAFNQGRYNYGVIIETFIVTDGNSPPTALVLDNASIAENQPSGSLVGTLSTIDPDIADTHTYRFVAGTGDNDNAAFSVVGDELTTAVDLDFETQETHSIRVQTNDGRGGTFEKILTITVTNMNDAPTADDDSGAGFNTDEDTPFVTGNVLVNDSDQDTGDVLFVQSVDTASSAGATITDNGDGTFGYDPTSSLALNALAAGASTNDTFTYTVGDGLGGSDIGTVSIAVDGLNDTPVLNTVESQTINEGSTLSFAVSASDDAGDVLMFTLSGAVPAGASIDPSSGVFTWGPTDAQGPATYSFDVVVTDDSTSLLSDSGTITVFVMEKLTASNGAFQDFFGVTLDINGDTAIVGTRTLDGGSAHIFRFDGVNWVEEEVITSNDSESFGIAVAIDGDTAIIGADRDRGGSAYVYVRSGTAWTQQTKLTASDGGGDDQFGASVAMNGNTVVVGAPRDDANRIASSGSAYVFVRSGSTWSQQAKLSASNGKETDLFGSSVAIDSDTVLVGVPEHNSRGSAYVFVRSGTTWTQQRKLRSGDTTGWWFGAAVSISGDTAIVGDYGDTTNGGAAGAAYVFVRSGTTWTQQQKLLTTDAEHGDNLGASVSISGDIAVVGANGDGDSGSAYIFTRSGTSWTQKQEVSPSDGAINYLFGSSAAIDGDTVLVGAHHAGDHNGAAYIFSLFSTP